MLGLNWFEEINIHIYFARDQSRRSTAQDILLHVMHNNSSITWFLMRNLTLVHPFVCLSISRCSRDVEYKSWLQCSDATLQHLFPLSSPKKRGHNMTYYYYHGLPVSRSHSCTWAQKQVSSWTFSLLIMTGLQLEEGHSILYIIKVKIERNKRRLASVISRIPCLHSLFKTRDNTPSFNWLYPRDDESWE